jgi:preprotein translocase subunit YajC
VFPAFLIQQQPNPLVGMILPIAMVVGMYLLLILPMQRQKKQTKAMLDGLKSGDGIVTKGGLVGTIFSIDAERDTLIMTVRPNNTKLEVARTAVAALAQESK